MRERDFCPPNSNQFIFDSMWTFVLIGGKKGQGQSSNDVNSSGFS